MQTAQHWVLPSQSASPALARRHLRDLHADLDPDLLEIALLLASELVTNAVKYGGQHIVLSVIDEPERLRVEVHDDGPSTPQMGAGESHALGGRGLLLVESLAHEWGTNRGSDADPGKGVWFTLRKS
jgi:anti-sigma regulatory factor (Ser/Thr protein kinase)